MKEIREILESKEFQKQPPFDRKIVIGQVSIAATSERAARPEEAKQFQKTRKADKNQKKNAA